MSYEEGKCFRCGKQIDVGIVCDACSKKHDDDELVDLVAEAEAQENFEN
jgi:hypothetical protein